MMQVQSILESENSGIHIAEKYTVMEILGQGGNGIVYKAWDNSMDRPVAVKELLGFGENQWKEEIRVWKKIVHPSIAQLYDVVQNDQMYFLIMEYVEGYTLEEYAQRVGQFSKKQLMELGEKILEILHFLHTLPDPVIFGDLKPENIMITKNGMIKLIDFGAATEVSNSKKRKGGTFGYSAPEQIKGESVDERADYFAFGAVMHRLITGKIPYEPPFYRENLRQCGHPAGKNFYKFAEKCLKDNPEERPCDIHEMKKEFEKCRKKSVLLLCRPVEYYSIKSVWKSTKTGMGLIGILVLFVCCLLSSRNKVYAIEKAGELILKDEYGRKLCMRVDAEYSFDGEIRMEIPKELMETGEKGILTMILMDGEENEISRKDVQIRRK